MKYHRHLTELIGKTPMLRLTKVVPHQNSLFLVKLEHWNPGGSIKDRIALNMLEDAERSGKLKPGMTIIEPTSGNTGIALSWIASVKGYKTILVMPESMSEERRNLLKAYGSELMLTPATLGMTGAIEKAIEIVSSRSDCFMPQQFDNPANPEIHRLTTAQEIWEDTDGTVDAFIAGVGTGGTITGVGEVLKAKKPSVKIFAIEPAASPVLSGGKPGRHEIQGIGAGFVPKVLNTKIYDEVIKVTNEEAAFMARRLAHEEGILAGISSGANIHALCEVGKRPEFNGKTLVAILCDTGERYLSTPLYQGH